MDSRELRYLRYYGKYIGTIFVMLERQQKMMEIVIIIPSVIVIGCIAYLVGVGMLATYGLDEDISGLLFLWVVTTGFMMSIVSILLFGFIAVLVVEIKKAYQSVRSDYARKDKE